MKKTKSPPAPKPAALTEKELAARNDAALARVDGMEDLEKLRNLMANADRMGVMPVRDAAFRRLALIQTEGEPGTIEYDALQTIFAYEQLVREELGKAKRLTRTRMKLTKSGAVNALSDFPTATAEYSAFDTLIARGLQDLTGEAVILRHADDFDSATRDKAEARLEAAKAVPEDAVTDA
ncbi:hypothetical protein SAMN05444004_10861 [Jannaschia faecimaris]|uniref:Uncharacterized protein n=1 Tax=Jannaschia faecimaris TaxID=1244108 RepID=A0A1H3RCP6_9RHOB|nr:hypothetical protein [Jannaschia faecimaris]SDZ23416.1 hypothetical protein SAMN05444004_10861 [Jannaschia faecimaris]